MRSSVAGLACVRSGGRRRNERARVLPGLGCQSRSDKPVVLCTCVPGHLGRNWVAQSRMTFHGFMPTHNPILGNFQHAPSSRNARSKYFDGDMLSWEEYSRLKALRHNPYTGQFHKGPQEYSNLHDLNRFRTESITDDFDISRRLGSHYEYQKEGDSQHSRRASESDLYDLTATACAAAATATSAAAAANAAAAEMTRCAHLNMSADVASSTPEYERVSEKPEVPSRSGIARLVEPESGNTGSTSSSPSFARVPSVSSSSSHSLVTLNNLLDTISDEQQHQQQQLRDFLEIPENERVSAGFNLNSNGSMHETNSPRPTGRRQENSSSTPSSWLMGGEYSDSGSSLDELESRQQPGHTRRRCMSMSHALQGPAAPWRRTRSNIRSFGWEQGLNYSPRTARNEQNDRNLHGQHLPLVASMGDLQTTEFDSFAMARARAQGSFGELSSQRPDAARVGQHGKGRSEPALGRRHVSMSSARHFDDIDVHQGRSRFLSTPDGFTSRQDAYASAAGGARLYSYDSDIPLQDGQNLPWIINRTLSITGRYKIDMTKQGCLGKGAYSLAKVCRNRTTDKEYCVKIVKKRMLVSGEEKEMVEREVKIHQVLQHRHIIRLHEIYEDQTRLFLVLEKADSGTLETLLNKHAGRLPELWCQRLFKQLLQALEYLHANGVLQGDLKPANLLLHTTHGRDAQSGQGGGQNGLNLDLKICDFGLSRKVPDVKFYKFTGDVHKVPFTTMCGTMGYMAPEIMKKEAYTIAVDMWAAGIILYEMMSGIKPFVPYADCLTVPLEFPATIFDGLSTGAPPLLQSLLFVDPALRTSPKAALESEWVASSLSNLMSD